jgi:hypothetical protein
LLSLKSACVRLAPLDQVKRIMNEHETVFAHEKKAAELCGPTLWLRKFAMFNT